MLSSFLSFSFLPFSLFPFLTVHFLALLFLPFLSSILFCSFQLLLFPFLSFTLFPVLSFLCFPFTIPPSSALLIFSSYHPFFPFLFISFLLPFSLYLPFISLLSFPFLSFPLSSSALHTFSSPFSFLPFRLLRSLWLHMYSHSHWLSLLLWPEIYVPEVQQDCFLFVQPGERKRHFCKLSCDTPPTHSPKRGVIPCHKSLGSLNHTPDVLLPFLITVVSLHLYSIREINGPGYSAQVHTLWGAWLKCHSVMRTGCDRMDRGRCGHMVISRWGSSLSLVMCAPVAWYGFTLRTYEKNEGKFQISVQL